MNQYNAQAFREAAALAQSRCDCGYRRTSCKRCAHAQLLLAAAEHCDQLDEANQRVQAMQKSVADCVEMLTKVEVERNDARHRIMELELELMGEKG